MNIGYPWMLIERVHRSLQTLTFRGLLPPSTKKRRFLLPVIDATESPGVSVT